MKRIPREAQRITYSTEIRELKKQILSEEQKAIIIGCVLGDGNLEVTNWTKNYRFRIEHSIKQSQYLFWKYLKLKRFVISKPKLNVKHKSYAFKTISHSGLTIFGKLFYRNKKKIIPKNIDSIVISSITLAVWYMDDGNIVIRNGKIIGFHMNTQSYSKAENQRLLGMLYDNFGINGILEKNHNKYRLAIWKVKDRERFAKIVRPHILKQLQYKVRLSK